MIRFSIAVCLVVAPLVSAFGIPDETIETSDPVKIALQHLQKGRYEEAIDAYGDLAKGKGQAVPATLGQAKAHLAVGHFEKAEALFTEALKLDSHQDEVLAHWAEYLVQRGRYSEADQVANKALQLNANQPYARQARAAVLTETGEIDEAQTAWRWFVRYYNREQPTDVKTLVPIGYGAANYARWTSSSGTFRFLVNTLCVDALKDNPDSWEARFLSGSLLLEKYNRRQGLPDLKSALAINPRATDVLAELGRQEKSRREYDKADGFADRCLEIHPRHIGALVLKADLAMRIGQFDDAQPFLKRGLDVNPRHQQLLARSALIALMDDQLPSVDEMTKILSSFSSDPVQTSDDDAKNGFSTIVNRMAGWNPRAGQFLTTVANGLDDRHQFELAELTFKKAIEVMPQLSEPRTALGMLYMQTGRTKQAREILDTAFKADPFHVRVSNMRKVLSVLEGYDSITTEHFVVHFDQQADRILGHLMADYLESVHGELVEDYGFEPERVHFEIYNKSKGQSAHQWFSARMVGLPWIQTIGASTGVMIAMASPTASRQKFNWARVAKHELAHVITLQQTKFRIPRWFTEGLAVTSEQLTAPVEWQRLLATRVPKGDLWKLDELNEIFVRYPSQADWSMAFCQARLYVKFMQEDFGADSIRRMLNAYRNGQSTNESIESVFSVSTDEFQQRYVEFLKLQIKKYGYQPAALAGSVAELKAAYNANNSDLTAKADYALALLLSRQGKTAVRLAEEVLEVENANPSACLVVAAKLMSLGEHQAAAEVLKPAASLEGARSDVVSMYGKVLLKSGEVEQAIELFEQGAARFPHEAKWLKQLADAWDKKGDTKRLRETLAKLIRIDRDDVSARQKFAEVLFKADEFELAAEMALETLYAAPMNPVAHRIRALSLLELQHTKRAKQALEFAILTNPKDKELKGRLAKLAP